MFGARLKPTNAIAIVSHATRDGERRGSNGATAMEIRIAPGNR